MSEHEKKDSPYPEGAPEEIPGSPEDGDVDEVAENREEEIANKKDLFIEGEGREDAELIERVERLAADAIAKIEELKDAFSNDSERMTEISRLSGMLLDMFDEIETFREESLKSGLKIPEVEKDKEYQYLIKQYMIYHDLYNKLRDTANSIAVFREIAAEISRPLGEEESKKLIDEIAYIHKDGKFSQVRVEQLDIEEDKKPNNMEEAADYVHSTIDALDAADVDNRVEANRQIKILELSKKIDELQELVIDLSQAESSDNQSQKEEALHKATEIINDEAYLPERLSDFHVPEVIEEAILVAREMIDKLEEELKKTDENFEEDVVPTALELQYMRQELEGGAEEFPAEGDDAEGVPGPVKSEAAPEEGIETESTELGAARAEYLKALEERTGFFNKKRKLGVGGYTVEQQQKFDDIKKKYEILVAAEQKEKLEDKKAELLTAMESGEIPEHLFQEYIELLEAEEAKIDEFATSKEKTKFQRFRQFWRKTAKSRLALGLGIAGAGVAAGVGVAALGVPAIAAFFGAGAGLALRGVMSGSGTYMAAEAHLDTRSDKLGQKGLIDEVSKMGVLKGLNIFKRGKINTEIIARLTQEAEEGNNVFDKYSKEQLQGELARLRALSLDKGVKLSEAGRFAASQSKLIELLQRAYYKKLREEFEGLKPTKKEEGRLQFLEKNTKEQIRTGELNFDDIQNAGDINELKKRIEGFGKIVDSDGKEYFSINILDVIRQVINTENTEVDLDVVPSLSGLRDAIRRIVENFESTKSVDADTKFDILNQIIDGETEAAQNDLVDQIDIDRKKKIKRHTLAAGLGLVSGVVVGTGTIRRVLENAQDSAGDEVGESEIDSSQQVEVINTDTDDKVSENPLNIKRLITKLFHKSKDINIDDPSNELDTLESEELLSIEDSKLSEIPDIGQTTDSGTRLDLNLTQETPDIKMSTTAVESTGAGGEGVAMENVDSQVAENSSGDLGEPRVGDEVASTANSPSEVIGESSTPKVSAEAKIPSVEQGAAGKFIDIINSKEVEGSDSIWRSTRTIFENNATELGYKGDPNDLDAISKWAETQTANAIDTFNTDNGGNLADLVHDGDKVTIEVVDGKPVLGFEASSGHEAGHLSDANVSKMIGDQKFVEGVEHSMHIDSDTGDSYMEITSDDDTYKIYDWDRDGNPNVIMPDGTSQEMSTVKLNELLTEKELIDTTDANVDVVVEGGDSSVTPEFSDQALQEIMENNEASDIEEYLRDYASSQGWNNSKATVFLSSLRDGSGNISNNLGGLWNQDSALIENSDIDKIMDTWEVKAVKGTFSDLKNIDSGHWTPIKVGDDYYFAQKVHSGPWPLRSDSYLIDLDGNLNTDASTNISGSAMEKAFEEGNLPESVSAKMLGVETEITNVGEPTGSSDFNFHESISAEDQTRLQEGYNFILEERNEANDYLAKLEAIFGEDKDFPKFSKEVEDYLANLDKAKSNLQQYIETGQGDIKIDELGPHDSMTAEGSAGINLDGIIANSQYFQDSLKAMEDANLDISNMSLDEIIANKDKITEALRAQSELQPEPEVQVEENLPEDNFEPNPDYPEGAKVSIPEDAESFMKEHNIRFENGRLFGVKGFPETGIGFEAVEGMEDQGQTEFIHFSMDGDNLKVEVIDTDNSIDSFVVDKNGDFAGGTGLEHHNQEPASAADVNRGLEEMSGIEGDIDYEAKAVEGINIFKPSLEFSMDKIEAENMAYLSEVREIAEAAEVVSREDGNLQLAKVYQDLIDKINDRFENPEFKKAA